MNWNELRQRVVNQTTSPWIQEAHWEEERWLHWWVPTTAEWGAATASVHGRVPLAGGGAWFQPSFAHAHAHAPWTIPTPLLKALCCLQERSLNEVWRRSSGRCLPTPRSPEHPVFLCVGQFSWEQTHNATYKQGPQVGRGPILVFWESALKKKQGYFGVCEGFFFFFFKHFLGKQNWASVRSWRWQAWGIRAVFPLPFWAFLTAPSWEEAKWWKIKKPRAERGWVRGWPHLLVVSLRVSFDKTPSRWPRWEGALCLHKTFLRPHNKARIRFFFPWEIKNWSSERLWNLLVQVIKDPELEPRYVYLQNWVLFYWMTDILGV